jgi:hypothetical protein
MAKVKTTEHEDDLSVIAEELKLVQQIVRDLRENTSNLTRSQAVYQQALEKERIESAKTLKSVISQEIESLKKVHRDIVSLEERAQGNIKKMSSKALQEVKDAVLIKSRTSNHVIWMLGICGILVALATIGILVKRNFDNNTIVAAIQEKAKYESLMLDLKQWAKENPKDAKSFVDWSKRK